MKQVSSMSEALARLRVAKRQPDISAMRAAALQLCRLLRLEFRSWLPTDRASTTHQIGIIANERDIRTRRWQIAWHSKYAVAPDDLATSFGLGVCDHPAVAIMATLGYFTSPARAFANQI